MLIEKPSPPGPWVGSGKFGTRYACMHFERANAELVDAVVELALAHAAITTAQVTVTSLMEALGPLAASRGIFPMSSGGSTPRAV